MGLCCRMRSSQEAAVRKQEEAALNRMLEDQEASVITLTAASTVKQLADDLDLDVTELEAKLATIGESIESIEDVYASHVIEH